MIDFDALVLDPVYGTFGKPAVLTTGSGSFAVTIIDRTEGVEVENGGVGVQTIRPAVDVRRSTLAASGIGVADLVGNQIVLGDRTWRIKTVIENHLELRLVVMQND